MMIFEDNKKKCSLDLLLMMIFEDNKKVQRTLLEKNKQIENELRQEKKKNEKLEEEKEAMKKKVEKLEEQQTKCKKLHQNNFSTIDTFICWVMNGFQKRKVKSAFWEKFNCPIMLRNNTICLAGPSHQPLSNSCHSFIRRLSMKKNTEH